MLDTLKVGTFQPKNTLNKDNPIVFQTAHPRHSYGKSNKRPLTVGQTFRASGTSSLKPFDLSEASNQSSNKRPKQSHHIEPGTSNMAVEIDDTEDSVVALDTRTMKSRSDASPSSQTSTGIQFTSGVPQRRETSPNSVQEYRKVEQSLGRRQSRDRISKSNMAMRDAPLSYKPQQGRALKSTMPRMTGTTEVIDLESEKPDRSKASEPYRGTENMRLSRRQVAAMEQVREDASRRREARECQDNGSISHHFADPPTRGLTVNKDMIQQRTSQKAAVGKPLTERSPDVSIRNRDRISESPEHLHSIGVRKGVAHAQKQGGEQQTPDSSETTIFHQIEDNTLAPREGTQTTQSTIDTRARQRSVSIDGSIERTRTIRPSFLTRKGKPLVTAETSASQREKFETFLPPGFAIVYLEKCEDIHKPESRTVLHEGRSTAYLAFDTTSECIILRQGQRTNGQNTHLFNPRRVEYVDFSSSDPPLALLRIKPFFDETNAWARIRFLSLQDLDLFQMALRGLNHRVKFNKRSQ